MEHQRTRFQSFFEFFLAEFDGLVVVVRAYDIELQSVTHEPS
jgi:hypothetical protein